MTPCGTIEVIAPEALGPGSDHRVDVWGVGLICYMARMSDVMFRTKAEILDGEWSLTDLNCSIEFLRFVCETVQFDRNRRPFADSVKDHPYFSVDLSKAPTIQERLPQLRKKQLACFKPQDGTQTETTD